MKDYPSTTIEHGKIYVSGPAKLNSADPENVLIRVTIEQITANGIYDSATGHCITTWADDVARVIRRTCNAAIKQLNKQLDERIAAIMETPDNEDTAAENSFDAYVAAMAQFVEVAKDRIDELGLEKQYRELQAAQQAFYSSGGDASEEEAKAAK